MSYRVLLSTPGALGVVELSGHVRWADLDAALHALYGHPAWEPRFATLWLGQRVSSFHVFPEDFHGIKAAFTAVATARAGGRTAIVSRASDFGLWALFPRLGPKTERALAIVSDLGEALAFVGRAGVPEEMELVASSEV